MDEDKIKRRWKKYLHKLLNERNKYQIEKVEKFYLRVEVAFGEYNGRRNYIGYKINENVENSRTIRSNQ